MPFSLVKCALCCGLPLLASGVYAQTYGYGQYPGPANYPAPVYDRPYGDRGGMGLFEQVQDDLNRASFDVYGGRGHINHARKEVGDVLHELARGRFDRGEMGEAIGAVEKVLAKDPLPEPDRAALWRDLNSMRRFRDRDY